MELTEENPLKKSKKRFTRDEDHRLEQLVKIYGPKNWEVIAKEFNGRCGRQCRDRYINYLSPAVKKTKWTPHEDRTLIEAFRKIGPKWSKIALEFKGRTASAIKNRWNFTISHYCPDLVKLYENGATASVKLNRKDIKNMKDSYIVFEDDDEGVKDKGEEDEMLEIDKESEGLFRDGDGEDFFFIKDGELSDQLLIQNNSNNFLNIITKPLTQPIGIKNDIQIKEIKPSIDRKDSTDSITDSISSNIPKIDGTPPFTPLAPMLSELNTVTIGKNIAGIEGSTAKLVTPINVHNDLPKQTNILQTPIQVPIKTQKEISAQTETPNSQPQTNENKELKPVLLFESGVIDSLAQWEEICDIFDS